METIDIFYAASITVTSLILLILSLFTYRKYRNFKLIFICSILALFLIKGIIFTLVVFNFNINFLDSLRNLWMFDLIILILLYLASLKR